jgi:hypothetical protein
MYAAYIIYISNKDLYRQLLKYNTINKCTELPQTVLASPQACEFSVRRKLLHELPL